MADTYHIVKPGDTLYEIGKQYGVPLDILLSANNLSNANELQVGQQIIIPALQFPNWYIVKKGDSLWAIANRFYTTVDEIVALNEFASPNVIFPGQIIRIR